MTAIETVAGVKPAQSITRQLLGIRNYRLLWIGQVFSDFSDSMTSLAVLLMINRLTGSVTAMATMSIAIMLPRLVLGFFAGVYVDRLNRKHLMVYSYLLRAVIVAGFLLVDSPDRIWLLYVVGFLQGSAATFFEPARSALLPRLVPEQALLAANSFTITSQYIFYMLGSAAAGVLVGVFDSFGPIFLINSAAFLLSALLISRIDHTPVNGGQKRLSMQIFVNQLAEGLKLSFGNRLLTGTIVSFALTMLGTGATNVLMVPFLINDLGVPETWMGATGIGQTVAIVICGSLMTALSNRVSPTRIIPWALIGFGVGTALVAAAHNIWGVLVFLFASALFIPAISSTAQTILQVAVPDRLRGRINSARMVVVITANLISMGAAGVLADRMGAGNVFILSGACAVLGGIAALLIFRGMPLKPILVDEKPGNEYRVQNDVVNLPG